MAKRNIQELTTGVHDFPTLIKGKDTKYVDKTGLLYELARKKEDAPRLLREAEGQFEVNPLPDADGRDETREAFRLFRPPPPDGPSLFFIIMNISQIMGLHFAVKVLCAICAALFISLPACAEQLWLTQGALFHATDTLRFSLYNTIYMEHGEQFSNEVSPGFRWSFATNWSVGAGMTFAQNRKSCEEVTDDGETIIHHHWAMGPRPSENIALEWTGKCGNWNFFDSNRVYTYFRKGERDWVVYRNIFTVTAPAILGAPWKSRPYLSQQIYFTGREGYDGLDRFSQFRTTAGLRLRPLEWLSLAAYWQYRDIERKTGEWHQSRVAGLSATLLF